MFRCSDPHTRWRRRRDKSRAAKSSWLDDANANATTDACPALPRASEHGAWVTPPGDHRVPLLRLRVPTSCNMCAPLHVSYPIKKESLSRVGTASPLSYHQRACKYPGKTSRGRCSDHVLWICRKRACGSTCLLHTCCVVELQCQISRLKLLMFPTGFSLK